MDTSLGVGRMAAGECLRGGGLSRRWNENHKFSAFTEPFAEPAAGAGCVQCVKESDAERGKKASRRIDVTEFHRVGQLITLCDLHG